MEEIVGQVAGIAAAFCWATASVLYARVPVGAGALTTFKNTLGAACLLVAVIVVSMATGSTMFGASASAWWNICWSGIFGLCLADIAYFRSIQILGARRGLTLTLLTPPAIAFLGQIWLGEKLRPFTWLCIAVTLISIGIVMGQKADRNADQDHHPGSTPWGIFCSLVGIAFMAIGAIFLKKGMDQTQPLEGTFIRLLAASLCGLVMGVPQGELRQIRELLKNRIGTRDLCAASMLGTVLGVSLMLVAYKYCPAGIAATLTSTTPLFVIPVVAVVYGERITYVAVIGAVIAFVGVCGLVMPELFDWILQ